MSFLYETIGVLGFIANLWANLLVARKLESGWVVRLVANALWMTYGIATLSIANILSSFAFTIVNIYALRRWRRERLTPRVCKHCGHVVS